jgi:structure-specific recognition protein 1
MGEFLEYPDVFQEVRGAMNPGKLKLQTGSIVFKNMKTGKLEQFSSTEVEETHWLIRSRGYCLKMIMNTGYTQRYDGFKETDFEKLSSFIQKYYHSTLLKKDMSVKGWNWGLADFIGNTLDFKIEGQTAFEIPLANVSRSLTARNEVTIEFTPNDDAAVSLVELRFHVPSDSTSEVDAVNEFHKNVMAKAEVIQVVGDAITSFTEVQCLTPRGRYDIKIYPAFLQLHGKTFDYKITYTSILRLFLLPHRDNRQMFFVVSLDPPIKQGQTRYHFLILLFNKETETTLELTISDEELEKKYDNKLSKEMSGPEYEIISRIMKTLVNKKITVPGSFVGHSGTQSIACSYKAATGYLYPLERGFIFVHKPPVHIRFDEIEAVNFARSAGNTRSFDFDVNTKTGTTYTFVGIEKDEYGKLYDYVSMKKLRVKNIGNKADGLATVAYTDDMMPSDDEDQDDAYMRRMKLEGKQRVDDDMGDDDDDDDESDEDFKPEGSASEPDDEYDSNPESTSDSGSEYGEGEEGGSDDDSGASDAAASGEEDDEVDRVTKKESVREKKEKVVKEKKPKKERKAKKEVDADKPKRPQTAFFLWLGENRAKIKEDFPGISVTEVTKKAGEQWKEVKDKSKWEALAGKQKEIYEHAMAEWKLKQKDAPAAASKSSPKKSKKASTAKEASSSTAGSGAAYKSKEFIDDSELSSSNESDEDEKPLKKKRKDSSDSEVGELPEDEAILSTPPSSGRDSASDSD